MNTSGGLGGGGAWVGRRGAARCAVEAGTPDTPGLDPATRRFDAASLTGERLCLCRVIGVAPRLPPDGGLRHHPRTSAAGVRERREPEKRHHFPIHRTDVCERTYMPRTFSPLSGVLPAALGTRLARLVHFGMVGGLAFVVDIGIYNLLRVTVMDDKPIGAKVISVAVATLVAWLGNRQLTFRAESSTRSGSVVREGVLFAMMNIIGLLIAAGCLFVSHYLLGFTSQLADNIAGNVVGLILGMTFRFTAYRYIVFRPAPAAPVRPVTQGIPISSTDIPIHSSTAPHAASGFVGSGTRTSQAAPARS